MTGDETIYGSYQGQLNNGGERLRLERPDSPPLDEPNFTPYLLEDEVLYADESPWPVMPDGGGASLRRNSTTAWGNSADSWGADGPFFRRPTDPSESHVLAGDH